MKFKLWLEYEDSDDPKQWDLENDMINIHILVEEGSKYALTVCTFKFIETARKKDEKNGANLSGKYSYAPDLLVDSLKREDIEKVVNDMIEKEGLPDFWLIDTTNPELN